METLIGCDMRYIVFRDDGRRLCQDDMLREFASYGSEKECCKVFTDRNRWRAERKVKSMNAHAEYMFELMAKPIVRTYLACIPDDHIVNAVGEVFKEVNGVSTGPFKLEQFV